MPERGGPTTQSGILYQNSVAALYLGRLCDTTDRPEGDHVTGVRVEAPESVDDIVVSHADGHTVYVQAKERVEAGDAAWRKLWRDFAAQFKNPAFNRTRDRLRLHVGEAHNDHFALQDLSDRARTSSSVTEWHDRLSQVQRAISESVAAAVASALPGDEQILHVFLAHVDVEVWTRRQIERDFVQAWMPATSVPRHTLFCLLRDRVGGEARIRGTFDALRLRQSLRAEHGIEFRVAPSLQALREAVAACGALLRQHKATLGATGVHVSRAVTAEIVAWAQMPEGDQAVGLLLDHAGRGKTVVMHDVMLALEDAGVPVLAVKADQQLSGIESAADLQRRLGFEAPAELVVARLAAVGRVVVLIDQIDALSLSLARDQQAMNVVLELVGRLRVIPSVTILLSCRTFDRNTDPRLKRVDVGREFFVPLLDDGEVASVLAALGVAPDTLMPATQELLRTPLHLDLYASLARTPARNPAQLRGIASLQELYGLLWEEVVRRPEPPGPSVADREAVLRAVTGRMHRDQHTSVPRSAVDALNSFHAARAADWLASVGVLVATPAGWTFLHQTFFDYCYARFFVEEGGRLRDAVLASDQGLFIRPQIVQVLAYLRGTNHPEYLRTLGQLLEGTGLRFHLHDLVLRWFGALPDPNDAEWTLLHRRLLSPILKHRTLRAIWENPVWFPRLVTGLLSSLLSEDDSTLNEQVIPYLASLLDNRETQSTIATLAQAWVSREGPWPNRAYWLVQRIRKWHAPEAIALYERMLEDVPLADLRHLLQLDDLCEANPASGIRILRRLFDRVVDAYIAHSDHRQHAVPGLGDALDALDGHAIKKAVSTVSAVIPGLFLDAMLPWLERAIAADGPDDDAPPRTYFGSDALTGLWAGRSGVRWALFEALTSALCREVQENPDSFRLRAIRLAALPFATPQKLLATVYRDTLPASAQDALHFVLTDARRLRLGNDDALLTRQLLRSLIPYLEPRELAAVERLILDSTGKTRSWDKSLAALRRRGIDQLHLLRTLPRTRLSPEGQDRLGELERKFPGIETPDHPKGGRGGVVGPPIPMDGLMRMPDEGWLGAMAKYKGDVRHAEFLRGGSRELAHQMQALAKENPRRFAELAARTPPNLDDDYAEAFIVGLAESDCPPEWVFDVVRRFALPERSQIRRRTGWALEQVLRRSPGLPQDLLALLEGWVRTTLGKDEVPHDTLQRDLWAAAINTDRGTALLTLLAALRKEAGDVAVQRRWALLDFVARDPSPVLRAAGLYELQFMLEIDGDRSISLFEEMVRQQPRLRSVETFHDLLYYGAFGHLARLAPYIREVMHADDAKVRQRGAELAIIGHLASLGTDDVEAIRLAEALTQEVLNGPAEWRRGAAQIYAHNMADYPGDQCVTRLLHLLNDSDPGFPAQWDPKLGIHVT